MWDDSYSKLKEYSKRRWLAFFRPQLPCFPPGPALKLMQHPDDTADSLPPPACRQKETQAARQRRAEIASSGKVAAAGCRHLCRQGPVPPSLLPGQLCKAQTSQLCGVACETVACGVAHLGRCRFLRTRTLANGRFDWLACQADSASKGVIVMSLYDFRTLKLQDQLDSLGTTIMQIVCKLLFVTSYGGEAPAACAALLSHKWSRIMLLT